MPFREKGNWGIHLWGFIHTISIIDFQSDQNLIHNSRAKECLKNITNTIPCDKCKNLYTEYLLKLDELDMSQSMVLFNWSIDLHNAVNKKHNKPEWTYEMAQKQWCNII